MMKPSCIEVGNNEDGRTYQYANETNDNAYYMRVDAGKYATLRVINHDNITPITVFCHTLEDQSKDDK
jgi:hypothetical protein